jgi:Nitrile hydratase, alpha chain
VVGDTAKGERAMSQASAGGGKRAEMERTLVQRSLQDESFRQRLLDDPKGTIEQELGSQLPESVEVRVVQESAEVIYLVLPSASPLGQGEELSDQQLEAVAGGGDTWDPTACTCVGQPCWSTAARYLFGAPAGAVARRLGDDHRCGVGGLRRDGAGDHRVSERLLERVILAFVVVIGSALIVEAFLPQDVPGFLPDTATVVHSTASTTNGIVPNTP